MIRGERRVWRAEARLAPDPLKTYPNVSQFWTWTPEEYMKYPSFTELKGKFTDCAKVRARLRSLGALPEGNGRGVVAEDPGILRKTSHERVRTPAENTTGGRDGLSRAGREEVFSSL